MKILLFGKNGQVGWELQRSLASIGEVNALSSDSKLFCGDLSNLSGIAETVRTYRPDVVVNASAYTAVDQAEDDIEKAGLINANAPTVLAQEVQKLGGLLVHYSTDYVYDGSGVTPWNENDLPSPKNAYGITKLGGEAGIIHSKCRHLILRTSWVYGARGHNFVRTMLNLAQKKSELKVVDDQIGAPTGAELIADVSAHGIQKASAGANLSGVYNLAAAGETSWFEYAKFVLSTAAGLGLQLETSLENVVAVTGDAFPTKAVRPCNSRLNTEKLEKEFDLLMPDWKLGVARVLQEILEDREK